MPKCLPICTDVCTTCSVQDNMNIRVVSREGTLPKMLSTMVNTDNQRRLVQKTTNVDSSNCTKSPSYPLPNGTILYAHVTLRSQFSEKMLRNRLAAERPDRDCEVRVGDETNRRVFLNVREEIVPQQKNIFEVLNRRNKKSEAGTPPTD